MPLYDDSKKPPGALHPLNAKATQLGRLEPLITPELVKSRFLKGIPMITKIKDPETGQFFRISDEELKDYIQVAVDKAETLTGLTLMPTQYSDKLPFQRQDYEAFGYMKLPRMPVSSIDKLTVRLADGSDVFIFPLEWIETTNLIWGQVNILPLAFQGIQGGTGIVGSDPTGNGGTAIFFNSLWNRPWVAALFGVEYTTGFQDGMMPKVVNELIGTLVAMRVLGLLAAAYANQTSVSLGIDGMSQGVSGPGPQRYAVRMKELEDDKGELVRKLRKIFGTAFSTGTV